jgi:hypothetical protein
MNRSKTPSFITEISLKANWPAPVFRTTFHDTATACILEAVDKTAIGTGGR